MFNNTSFYDRVLLFLINCYKLLLPDLKKSDLLNMGVLCTLALFVLLGTCYNFYGFWI